MAEATETKVPAESPKGQPGKLARFGHWLMQEGRLPSIGRELAYAVEDIRHKVLEEGMFGRQVTPSTFPRDDPPPALPAKKGPGIHGEKANDTAKGGPDIHGNGGPASGSPSLSPEEKLARKEKFYAMCREVVDRHPSPERSVDRSPGVSPPSR